uniref:ORF31 n=1 Tax=Nitrosopumilaceae spindle-shaped virus TaxID=3065433 RepID=A0AAT9JAF1_9VIRU
MFNFYQHTKKNCWKCGQRIVNYPCSNCGQEIIK